MRKLLLALPLFCLLFLSACGDDCSSYSEFTCAEIEAADYNVYFYESREKNDEYFLGTVAGLPACHAKAKAYAQEKNLPPGQDGWTYDCCMAAKGSECYEKHK